MVTIVAVTTDKCMWCLENVEGVKAHFKDGLGGFLCKKHFWQALKVRTEAGEGPAEPSTKSAKGSSVV